VKVGGKLKIRSERLRVTNETNNGLLGYYEIEIYGLLSRLKGRHYAQAHYGHFENTGNRTLLYSATVYVECGEIYHNYKSEFEDDLDALLAGNVDLFD
jgi:hypothetical protein